LEKNSFLIVEDSNVLAKVMKQTFEKRFNCEVDVASTYAEAEELLSSYADTYFCAFVDLTLPDCDTGEAVDLVIEHKVPTIVFTADISDDTQDFMWSKNLIDYVIKGDIRSIDLLVSLVERLKKNQQIKTLVIDDSPFSRKIMKRHLEARFFQVLEAANGVKGLEKFKENPDVALIIVDYNMPEMDGFEFTQKIRKKVTQREVPIIGVSGEGGSRLSSKFIKKGANDFIVKPFSADEFFCRVEQNIELIEHIKKIEQISFTDYLTGLWNRRYFLSNAKMLLGNARRSKFPIAVCMIDIDFFKKVNDTYGHEAGDLVLQRVAAVLQESFRSSDIVSRFGGEEFCVLAAGVDAEKAQKLFDDVRKNIESLKIDIDGKEISVTVSIGFQTDYMMELTDMINSADECLFKAKEQGRNRVICPDESEEF
jgi:diguanylate cyclase (GGDEF)-like protein